jgi:type II secretory pathway pseudopilin PulG
MGICAVFMLLVGILAAVLRIVLQRQNRQLKETHSRAYAGVPLDDDGDISRAECKPFEYML